MEDDVRSDLWTYPTAKCSEPFNNYSARDYITIIPVDYPRPDCSVAGMSLSDKSQEAHRDPELTHAAHPLSSSWHSPPISHHLHNPRPSSVSCYSASSMRQDEAAEWRREELRQPTMQKKYEICVFLVNKVGLCLEMDSKIDSSAVLAQDILDLIFQDDQDFVLPPEARDIFSLWLISPLLELQLKPLHRPFIIRQQWDSYLRKYTSATSDQIDKDDPLLFFQRNIFFDKVDEQKIIDTKVMELLYEEAKANILEGRYPCEPKDAEMLASIQARLELGPYDSKVHTPEFFRKRLHHFLPSSACSRGWTLPLLSHSKSSPEQRIIEQYRNIYPNNVIKLRRKYLEFCWTLPYYGSAFFPGQIEKPVKGIAALMNHFDEPVMVAINREGVHVMDPKQGSILLGLKYREMSWDYAYPPQSDKPECLPCLFLQFKIPSHSRRESKVLQIFSRQASLMDNLISAFVDEMKQRSSWEDEVDGADFPDSSHDEDDELASPTVTHRPMNSSAAVASKLQRLSLSTFNDEGDCIDCRGSLAFK